VLTEAITSGSPNESLANDAGTNHEAISDAPLFSQRGSYNVVNM
jgi:hypothetical protein